MRGRRTAVMCHTAWDTEGSMCDIVECRRTPTSTDSGVFGTLTDMIMPIIQYNRKRQHHSSTRHLLYRWNCHHHLRSRRHLRRRERHERQEHRRGSYLPHQLENRPPVTRASTRSNPNTDDTFDSSHTPNQLLYLAKGEPRIKTVGMREDFAHEGDPLLSYKSFTYATSNPDDKRFSDEVKRVLQTPRSHNDAINSPEHKEWKAAFDKEMDSLKEHQVYELVPITSVPKDTNIIGSRFVFF